MGKRKKAGIYTRKGDTGMTSLGNSQRVSKTNARICAVGSIDELNSMLGLAIALQTWSSANERDKKFLLSVQEDLFTLGAELSLGSTEIQIENDRIAFIEEMIDEISAELEPLKNFILPGGYIRAAWCHILRSVARRAERDVCRVAEEEHIDANILIYLNRLSDLFFVMARKMNANGKQDVLWKPR